MTSTLNNTEISSKICHVLMVDKEKGISSKDVSRRLEKVLGKKTKMGHCGTLDPMASGVLPIVLGSATKIQAYLSVSMKTYEFTVELGTATDTLDADGETLETQPIMPFNKEKLSVALIEMQGSQLQTPPIYSAKKFKGKPLYWYARNDRIHEVDMSRYTREIHIYSLEVLVCDATSVRCRSTVSSGTYIRVLGEEIAKATGNLGHLSYLRRTDCAGVTTDRCLKSSLLLEHSRQEILDASHCPTSLEIENLGVLSGIDEEDKKLLLFGREIPLNPAYTGNIGLAEANCSGKTKDQQWILADDQKRPFGLGTTRKVDTNYENTVKLFRGF